MELVQLMDVRKDFPILNQLVNGKQLIYLDSSATSLTPRQVVNAENEYYEKYNANVHRALHTLSEIATQKYEEARTKIAKFINAKSNEIIFQRNATEAINLVARSYGKNLSSGDIVLLTEMEHHSNIVPWQILAKEKNIKIEYIPITNEGRLDLYKAKELINKKPKILAVTHVSNVLGTINPIKDLIELAHKNGAKVLVDAAQSIPHLKVDVKDIDADFLVFSGHKMLGPTGIGILYGKKEILETMEPMLGGGDMIKEVTKNGAIWNDIPYKFEAGTQNIAGAIALGVAVDYIEKIGIENIQKYEETLTVYLLEKLKKLDYIKIYGPLSNENRLGVLSFNIGDIHAHDLTTVLDEEGIAIRSGHACAMPLMQRLNIDAVARVSLYIHNSIEDIDKFISALEKAKKVFRL